MLDIGFAAGRRLDVQNLASLIESQSGGGESAAAFLLCGIFTGCLGLFVGFGEGTAEDPGSGDDDLGDDTVSLLNK